VERDWAWNLLSWRDAGASLTAEVPRARYFVRSEPYEITAHAEVRDPAGRYRADLGSFATVALAQAACEADAQRWCRRGPLAGGPGTAPAELNGFDRERPFPCFVSQTWPRLQRGLFFGGYCDVRKERRAAHQARQFSLR
jgi:hypothetical protein